MAPKIKQWLIFLSLLACGVSSCASAAAGQNTGGLTQTRLPSNTAQETRESTRILIPSLKASSTQGMSADTPQSLAASSIIPSQTTTLTPATLLPDSFFITNISGHHQYFPLGCEVAAAVDWAHYFGININEYDFQYHLPISDNPDDGFVGNVNGPWGQVPPYAYGVYAKPVAALLTIYGAKATAYKQYTLEQLKAKIANQIPVMVWVIGNVEGGVQATYVDKSGQVALVAAYEHVVIVTGYDADHIRYMNNGKFYTTPTKVFLNSWSVLDNMVVVDK